MSANRSISGRAFCCLTLEARVLEALTTGTASGFLRGRPLLLGASTAGTASRLLGGRPLLLGASVVGDNATAPSFFRAVFPLTVVPVVTLVCLLLLVVVVTVVLSLLVADFRLRGFFCTVAESAKLDTKAFRLLATAMIGE